MALLTLIVEPCHSSRRTLLHHLNNTNICQVEHVTTTAREAIKRLHSAPIDLVFLEAVLPDLSGIDILQQYRKHSLLSLPLFVFISEHSALSCAAFQYRAAAFLSKPLCQNRFMQTLTDVARLNASIPHDEMLRLTIGQGKEQFFLNTSELLYAESAGNYVCLHTQHDNYVIRYTLQRLRQHLPSYFLQVHRSFIVNSQEVREILHHHTKTLKLRTGQTLPLSREMASPLLYLLSTRARP